MVLCDECGKIITGYYISDNKNDGKKYCSQVCFDKAHPCSVCGKKGEGRGKNGKLYCNDCWEGKGKLEDLFGESSIKDTNDSSPDNSKSSNASLGFFIIFLIALICLVIFLKRKFGRKKK